MNFQIQLEIKHLLIYNERKEGSMKFIDLKKKILIENAQKKLKSMSKEDREKFISQLERPYEKLNLWIADRPKKTYHFD